MQHNYIYLSQETRFNKNKENIFKVGITKNNSKSLYTNKLFFKIVCKDCENIKNDIVTVFKSKYIQKDQYGPDHFEGDFNEMVDYISNLVNESNKLFKDVVVDKNYIDKNRMNKICDLIATEFPNYKDDVIFGGNQKLFKIKLKCGEYVSYGIEESFEFFKDEKDDDEDEEERYISNKFSVFKIVILTTKKKLPELKYFKKLLDSKTIKLNEIYDYKSLDFLAKINNLKINIKLKFYYQFVRKYRIVVNPRNFNDEITTILLSEVLINDKLYAVSPNYNEMLNWNNFETYPIFLNYTHLNTDIEIRSYMSRINIIKLNGKYYEEGEQY